MRPCRQCAERGHHTLHAHEARALDEDRRARLREFPRAFAERLAVGEMLGASAEGSAGLVHRRPRGQKHLDAAALRVGADLIDDTYNANPDSVRAAIDLLAAAAPRRILILGDMGEVGSRSAEYHREVGAYAKSRGIDALLGTGAAMREACDAFGAGAEHFADIEELQERAQELARRGATVLVKGSRFMRMERVVASLGAATAGAH